MTAPRTAGTQLRAGGRRKTSPNWRKRQDLHKQHLGGKLIYKLLKVWGEENLILGCFVWAELWNVLLKCKKIKISKGYKDVHRCSFFSLTYLHRAIQPATLVIHVFRKCFVFPPQLASFVVPSGNSSHFELLSTIGTNVQIFSNVVILWRQQ